MSWPKGQHPGALWRKADLQVHTPRDPHYQGSDPLPGGSPKNEDSRRKWAKEFLDACVTNGVHVVAITDHHDICLARYVQEEVSNAGVQDSVWVFPGVEVTTNDSLQCLVILDRDATKAQCDRVIKAMPAISPEDPVSAKLPQAGYCGKTLKELVNDLNDIAEIKGSFIVLPNGSKSSGHKTILDNNHLVTFRDLDFEGVYTDGPYDDLKQPDLDKLYGRTPHWGTFRRGVFPTSDARHLDRIGENPCWIRLAEPTAEALRQALLVDRARIAYSTPQSPSTVIEEVKINSSLTGKERKLNLNEGLNTVIGGRGAGKSAILEYIRFGLGRATMDISDFDQEHNRGLVQETLKDGYVTLTLLRDGLTEVWRRDMASSDSIQIEVDNQSFSIGVADARERMQARAFSQKELSSLMDSPESARRQVTSLVAAEDVSRQTAIKRDLRSREGQINSAISRYVKAVRDEKSSADLYVKRNDLERRLKSIAKRLEEGGLSQDEQSVLNLSPEYDEFHQTVLDASSQVQELQADLAKLSDSANEITIPSKQWIHQIDGLTHARERVDQKRQRVVGTLQTALNELNDLGAAVDALASKFGPAHKAMREQVQSVEQKQTELSQLVSQQSELQNQLVEQKKALHDVEKSREDPRDAFGVVEKEAREVYEKADELFELLKGSAQKSERLGSGLITAEVKHPEEPKALVAALKGIGEKCNIVDVDAKCRSAARKIMVTGWKEGVWRLVQALLRLLAHQIRKEKDINDISADECRQHLGTEYLPDLTDNQIVRLCQNLTNEKIATLICFPVEPYVAFQYMDSKNKYIDFDQASPGQQASALLEILLNQDAGPLLIDQPEDDLDNQRIMTLIDTLHNTKQNRQLVFATHNPNFVVNGDADKVFALASPESEAQGNELPRLRVSIDGSLETARVKEAITETMEGGRRAFEIRRRKYRF